MTRTQRLVRWGVLLILPVLVGLMALGEPARAEGPSGGAWMVDARDRRGLEWLRANGAVLLADYGGYSLWELPAAAGTRRSAVPPTLRPAPTRTDFRGLALDSAAPGLDPVLPQALRATIPPAGAARLWLEQFAGPPQDAWLDALRAEGQQVVACFPGNTCLLWGEPPAGLLQKLGRLARRQAEYHPAYRLHPDLRPGGRLAAAGGVVDLTVQVLDVPEAKADLEALGGLAERLSSPARPLTGLINLRVRAPVSSLAIIAGLATVINVEPAGTPVKNDELQAQILAGNVSTAGVLTGEHQDYLAWLAAKGLPTDPDLYPIVDIVDDGVDQGNAGSVLHPDFHLQGSLSNPDRIVYMQSCLADLTTNGVAGHGNLNAGIVAGYNDQKSGFPYANAAGPWSPYRFGLGISPFGRLASTKVFTDPGNWEIANCDGTYSGLVRRVYAAGARIANNSWGDPSAMGAYDTGAQEYDALVRDADPLSPGNQELLHVFSAGNDGFRGAGTVGSPGTAKNVLTVGATDFPRTGGSSENLAYYSSLGPTDDGRAKPDLVAPGSAIQGPASMDPNYNGTGVWARYYPVGQTLYTYSYGTSHAAPAVAGAAQLAYAHYAADHAGLPPSPAMLKAMLLNGTRYLNGSRTGGSLPSPNQGWGMADTARLFEASRLLVVDQNIVFSSSGESHTWNLALPRDAGDLRVTLVWTDAPASPVSPGLVNDLDLEVTASGITYIGNVFSGGVSAEGGFADETNNVESVFLPFGRYTQIQVRVNAWMVAGDGIPGNPDLSDQDFALLVTSRTGYTYYFPFFPIEVR